MHFYINSLIYITVKEKGGNEMNKNYIVSWFDSEGNEWLSDWCKFAEAKKLFDEISGGDENKVDPSQVRCELYSDASGKVLMGYDNIENKYYNC